MSQALKKDFGLNEFCLGRYVESEEPTVFADIYRNDTNITIWKRSLPNDITHSVNHILKSNSSFNMIKPVSVVSVFDDIHRAFGNSEQSRPLCDDITTLVDMFCCIFNVKRAGFRLTALNHAMCPRFHVDHVPCRLVTTYLGYGTEWLPHKIVDRTKLGAGNQGKPDEHSGLFSRLRDIQRLTQGDVALLKGESWEGNENAGLVHRSPSVTPGERRLLLSIDFV
ncbi:DUF1826 domain-containing protein [Pleionea sediminis]|uniref:DUF1826 domain-containing protein n=1 Tax=Pleionea sediminis TaxID=2569479 RepID=UPI001185C5DA|nr:DUF1826 domain-containing protein [Pleionea sediminis]